MSEDYYELLGVRKDADKDEIKSAFRQKARKLHPDVNKGPNAEEQFKALGKAYETLMDDEKRALYDQGGEEGLQNAGYSSSGPFDAGFGNLNDILESFFGNLGGMGGFSARYNTNPNAPQQGSDIRVDIELEFEEAVFGIEKEIKIDHLTQCPECKGTGVEAGKKPEICPTCKGTGRVQHVMQTPLGQFAQVAGCPNCNGTGQKITNPCKGCHGSGLVEKEKTLNVKIPKGIEHGTKIRVANEGDTGKNAGPSGDLYIVTHVKEHAYFQRNGFDIHTELPISFPQAALGDEIIIKTLDGEKKISIPAHTQSGKVITLNSLGVPFLGHDVQRGNHYVTIKVVTPSSLSDEEKKLYSRLFELQTGKTPNENILQKFKNALHS